MEPGRKADRPRGTGATEEWVDDTAEDGEALCQPEDMSPSVEYVRWSNVPVQQLDVNWEGR